MKNIFQIRKSIVELALRINLSFAFMSYGYGKVRGGMFKNKLPNMDDMKLSEIDMFHLTWYWFDKNKELSVLIGVMQIISALLLVFNRTKLIGALIFLPIISGILMIDIFCVQAAGLIGRVSFYLCICVAILVGNIKRLTPLLIIPEDKKKETSPGQFATQKNVIVVIQFIVFLMAVFVMEILIIALFNMGSKMIS